MTKEIKSEIKIYSTPDKIWSILIDFKNFPGWNPFMTSITGKAEIGSKLVVHIQPPNGQGMTFKPTVLSRIENKELSWLGKFIFSGLFDGKHKFELTDNMDGSVTFKQSEIFNGIFVGLFNPEKTKNGFIEMNKKLKELAEKE